MPTLTQESPRAIDGDGRPYRNLVITKPGSITELNLDGGWAIEAGDSSFFQDREGMPIKSQNIKDAEREDYRRQYVLGSVVGAFTCGNHHLNIGVAKEHAEEMRAAIVLGVSHSIVKTSESGFMYAIQVNVPSPFIHYTHISHSGFVNKQYLQDVA